MTPMLLPRTGKVKKKKNNMYTNNAGDLGS